jgi:hypothetical protein
MNISASELRRAAAIKDKVEALQAELDKILAGHDVGTTVSPASKVSRKKGVRRKMSAAARARIAAGARARWAKAKAAGKNRL